MVLPGRRLVRGGPSGLDIPSDEAVRLTLTVVVAFASFRFSTNFEAEKLAALIRRELLSAMGASSGLLDRSWTSS